MHAPDTGDAIVRSEQEFTSALNTATVAVKGGVEGLEMELGRCNYTSEIPASRARQSKPTRAGRISRREGISERPVLRLPCELVFRLPESTGLAGKDRPWQDGPPAALLVEGNAS
jgi:hypothetical protein